MREQECHGIGGLEIIRSVAVYDRDGAYCEARGCFCSALRYPAGGAE